MTPPFYLRLKCHQNNLQVLIFICLNIVCQSLDDEFLELARKYNVNAGSTLLLSLIQNGRFTIANIGDSAAMLLKSNGKVLKLTDEQTPDRDDEYNRIIRNNGFVAVKDGISRVDGNIAVSRAIGD